MDHSSANADAYWTVTSVGVNNTDSKLLPVTPNSTAMWYGSVEINPSTILPNTANGDAGKFRATSGTATGTTGMSAYASPDPTKMIFLLFMMPFGAGEVNETRVGFIDINSKVDSNQVETMWKKPEVGTNAQHQFKDKNGKYISLYLESKIDQGTNVQATYALSYI